MTSLDVRVWLCGGVSSLDVRVWLYGGVSSLDVWVWLYGGVTSLDVWVWLYGGVTSLDVWVWLYGGVTSLDVWVWLYGGVSSLDVCSLLGTVTGKRALASTPTVSDEHKLLYDISKRVQNVEYYDTLGFGAGGLPPSSFSHILRNWGNFTKPEQFVHDNRVLTGQGRVIQVPKETVAVRQGGRGQKRPFRSTDDENSPKAKRTGEFVHIVLCTVQTGVPCVLYRLVSPVYCTD